MKPGSRPEGIRADRLSGTIISPADKTENKGDDILLKKITLLLVCLLFTGGVSAQETNDLPLTRLLGLVPDTSAIRESLITYADYRVVENARGIEPPTAQDFEERSERSALWVAASMRLSGGLDLSYLLMYLTGMSEQVGFGFFDIDRAIVFDNPPQMGAVLEGDFNSDAIAAAFAARDYAEETIEGLTVWCPNADCDGQRVDLANINPANPFGGRLGRSEPLAILSPTLLGQSPSFDTLSAIIATSTGERASLADSPEFIAVAEAISDAGSVVQAMFVSPIHTLSSPPDPALLLEAASDEDARTTLEARFNESGSLPFYWLVAFGDVSTNTEEIALITLAYSNAEVAQSAGDALKSAFETTTSLMIADKTYGDLAVERGATVDDAYVYEASNGWFVTVLPLRRPLPSNEIPEGRSGYDPSGLIYRLLVQTLQSRDTAYLAVEMAAE